MTSLKFSALLMALAAVPAMASPAVPATAPAKTDEKPVCRSVSATGSYMRQRVCHTKAEWAAIKELESSKVDRMLQDRRNSADNR